MASITKANYWLVLFYIIYDDNEHKYNNRLLVSNQINLRAFIQSQLAGIFVHNTERKTIVNYRFYCLMS